MSIMLTEKDKMLAGEWYNAGDIALIKERVKAHKLCAQYNLLASGRGKRQLEILSQLIPSVNSSLYIEPPFHCDYGFNLKLGEDVYLNFSCTVLDCAPVTIGNRVKFGPNVQLYTVNHPLNATQRAAGLEQAQPINIEDDVWIGGGVTILPGVTIGARSVVGAGSVVTCNIPADSLAVGNPCKVKKAIDNG